jgi:hypothetical protein
MSKFVNRMAVELHVKYNINRSIGDIEDDIQKYTTINTPDGEKWMVKYKSEWYLLDCD